MTTSAPKTNQETWLDWMPSDAPKPEQLFTRAELIDRVRAKGAKITDPTLVSWEKLGILPRAVRGWHDGKQAALYPEWMVRAVETASEQRSLGYNLDSIRWLLRRLFRNPSPEAEQAFRKADEAQQAATQALRTYARLLAESLGEELDGVDVHINFKGGRSYGGAWFRVVQNNDPDFHFSGKDSSKSPDNGR
jgi:hypothetical protein